MFSILELLCCTRTAKQINSEQIFKTRNLLAEKMQYDLSIAVEKSKNEFLKINSSEANLIWDEYKYRHDLIWKHMIRSTLLLAALIALPYIEKFDENPLIVFLASAVALLYQIYNYCSIIVPEIRLLYSVKRLHRRRQIVLYGAHFENLKVEKDANDQQLLDAADKKIEGNFKNKVLVYSIIVFIASVFAIAINIYRICQCGCL